MYCLKCGYAVEEGSDFCSICGTPLRQVNSTMQIDEQTNNASWQTESMFGFPVSGDSTPDASCGPFENQAFSNNPPYYPEQYYNIPGVPQLILKHKEKNSIFSLLLTIILALIIICIAATAVLGVSAVNTKKYDELIDTGNKYLKELKYEEAVETFLEAIDVKPKQEEAYVGAANGYIGLNEPENAMGILEKGFKNVKNPGKKFLDLCDKLGLAYVGQKVTVSSTAEESVTVSETVTRAPDTTEQESTTLEVSTQQSNTTAPASGTIKITSVSPSIATPGVETTFSVTVRYTSTNAQGCIIYAGANTDSSNRYSLYDEYQLPNTSGSYTFNFSCTPTKWDGYSFGIYVNISEYPHPDSWSPFAADVYPIRLS